MLSIGPWVILYSGCHKEHQGIMVKGLRDLRYPGLLRFRILGTRTLCSKPPGFRVASTIPMIGGKELPQ